MAKINSYRVIPGADYEEIDHSYTPTPYLLRQEILVLQKKFENL